MHWKTQIVSEAYVYGLAPSILKYSRISDTVCINDSGRRYVQKAVATSSYYGSGEERYDVVILTYETTSSSTQMQINTKSTRSSWLGL